MGYPRNHFTTEEEYRNYRKIQNEKYKIYQKKNRTKINRNERERKKRMKIDVMSHYSDGEIHCLHCGETQLDFLTMDHINGRKSWNHLRRMRGHTLYSWLIKNGYPSGFQVLCWNWNQIKEKKEAEIQHSKTKDAKRGRKNYHELKKMVFSKYSQNKKPQCSCCGYNELDGLAIDHIDGRKNTEHKIGLYADKLVRWLRDNNYPNGFQILCFNCNSGRQLTDNNICPHKL